MRTIIAGSRTITDYSLVEQTVAQSGVQISIVLSGKELSGVDALGERWAREHGIPVEEYPADWNTYGKKAGPLRNKEMAQNAEALILIWDGKSPGSKNMLMEAIASDLKIFQLNTSQLPQSEEVKPTTQEPTFTNTHVGKWFQYCGTSDKLLRQYEGVLLQVVSDNGAFATCLGTNDRYYQYVPLFNCREVKAPRKDKFSLV